MKQANSVRKKILAQKSISVKDWQALAETTPKGENKLLWCMSCIEDKCVSDVSFDSLAVYFGKITIKLIEACEESDLNAERKQLLALGLAAKVFGGTVPDNLECAQALKKAAYYTAAADPDIYAQWYALKALNEYLRTDSSANMRMLFFVMQTMNRIRDRYQQTAERLANY